MTAPEYGIFKVGNTQYPLDGYLTNSLLKDADPAIYWMLEYFGFAIPYYAGVRFNAEKLKAKLNVANLVGMKFPNNPFPYIQDTGMKFPLLAIYRVDGKIKEKTFSYYNITSNIEIVYILPSLSMSQMEICGPVLNCVKDILVNRSELGADPNFNNNFNWGQAAGFEKIQMTDYYRRLVPNVTTNLPMEAIIMRLTMVERNNTAVDGQYVEFDGVDTQIDLINNPNDDPPEIMEHFVDINSDYNPSNFPP